MNSQVKDRMKLAAAFFAGQIAMLSLLYIVKPTPAHAHSDGESLTTESLFVRKGPAGAGIQITAASASGGPGITFFDAAGASKMQLSLDGAGKPIVLMRGKTGTVAIGIGLQGEDQPTIAVRGPKGTLVTLPVPDK